MNKDYNMDQRIFSLLHKTMKNKRFLPFQKKKKMAWYDNEQSLIKFTYATYSENCIRN